ncbi:MAG: cytochrome c maturation protein CcmE [Sphingomonadaceae bacterium]
MASRASPKSQRLMLGGLAAVALLAAGLIAATALKDTGTFFYSPSDLAANPPAPGARIRIGGLVKEESVARLDEGLTLAFVVTDGARETAVRYTGIVPDLFREGQGVVATGRLQPDGRFVADQLLAKHDETYMPPEVAKSLHKTGSLAD